MALSGLIAGAMTGLAEGVGDVADTELRRRELFQKAQLELQMLERQWEESRARVKDARRYSEQRYGVERKDKLSDAELQQQRMLERIEAQKTPGASWELFDHPTLGPVQRSSTGKIESVPQQRGDWETKVGDFNITRFNKRTGATEIFNSEGTLVRRIPGAGGRGDEAPPIKGARRGRDGNWYVPDPERKDKWLRVEPGGGFDIPEAAVRELRSDPSTDARREFDEAFGKGAADHALGGSSQPTEAHIKALRENPDRAVEFDKKFGVGAAERFLGEPSTKPEGPAAAAQPGAPELQGEAEFESGFNKALPEGSRFVDPQKPGSGGMGKETREQAYRRNLVTPMAMRLVQQAEEIITGRAVGVASDEATQRDLVQKLEKLLQEEPLKEDLKAKMRAAIQRLTAGLQQGEEPDRSAAEFRRQQQEFERGFEKGYRSPFSGFQK